MFFSAVSSTFELLIEKSISEDQKKEIEREVIYRRLSRFSAESLPTSFDVDCAIVYPHLFSGFMRESQTEVHVVIPSAVLILMRTFYIEWKSPKLTMESIKFGTKNGEKITLLQPYQMDVTHWSSQKSSEWSMGCWGLGSDWDAIKRRGNIDGIIFVIDLMSYDEHIVDEDGKKWNKLEYALSQRDEAMELFEDNESIPKVTLLTKVDEFGERVKIKPLSVCPLFTKKENMSNLDSCINAISGKMDKWFCVKLNDMSGIVHVLKDDFPLFVE